MPKVTGKDQATREQLLADALRAVLVKAGVLGQNAYPTGPELLLAAEAYLAPRQWASPGYTDEELKSIPF